MSVNTKNVPPWKMIDRCNIGIRQARDNYNILSLFFFNYITQKEPFPRLPLDYELRCSASYQGRPNSQRPREKKTPQRNNVDVRLNDGELNLIKQREIQGRKRRAETRRLSGTGPCPSDALEIPPAHSRAGEIGWFVCKRSKCPVWVSPAWKHFATRGCESSLLAARSAVPSPPRHHHITAAPLTVWREVTNASVWITAIPPVFTTGLARQRQHKCCATFLTLSEESAHWLFFG